MNHGPILCLLACAVLAACGGTPSPIGLDQPFYVNNAAFKSGELPGSPAPKNPSAPEDERSLPLVTGIEPPSTLLLPGQTKKAIPGRTTDDAYSVALRFKDEGSGYWVIPLGPPDTNFPGELSFRAELALSPELEAGEHVLLLVAFDKDGVAGEQFEYRFCALRPYDSTLNACDPSVLPPAAVISLVWDADADLDLVVRTPSGKLVDASHPTSVEASDSLPPDPDAPGVGVLQRDSNAGCDIDSVRRENLVWNHSPESGTYLVYVNVFEACGRQAMHFDVESYVRTRGEAPDTFGIAALRDPISGVILGTSANGGAKTGLFVGTVEFP